jgi:predicted HTH transcriptional regulator
MGESTRVQICDQKESPMITVVKNVVKSEEKTVEKVWGLIKEDPYITTKQIADAIGLSTRGIEENIKKLKKTRSPSSYWRR